MLLFYFKEYLTLKSFQLFFIISVISGIILFFYYKNFRVVNQKLLVLIRIGSCFSLLLVVLFWIIALFLPKNNSIVNNYRYLISPGSFEFRSRILDDNDTMPLIKDVSKSDEIDKILKNKELMDEMLRGLIQNNLPCVFSYNIKKIVNSFEENEENEIYPNFIILNKKFGVMNKIGKMIKYFTSWTGIQKSIWSKVLYNLVGLNNLQGPFYFIFNANVTGGSLFMDDKDIWVRHSTLNKWDNGVDMKFRKTIQIECVSVYFYNDEPYYDPSILTFQGRLAVCLQDYLLSIENYRFSYVDEQKEEEQQQKEEEEEQNKISNS